jgi:hypothetical protein
VVVGRDCVVVGCVVVVGDDGVEVVGVQLSETPTTPT